MVIKSLRRSKDGLKAAVRRLKSGIFSLLSGLRPLTAEARYLLGKTRRKKPGKRPSASISPPGRRQEKSAAGVHSFPVICGAYFDAKAAKTETKKSDALLRDPGWLRDNLYVD